MPELTVDLKKISVKELAEKMEQIDRDEDKNQKEWEDMASEDRQAVELIVAEMLLGMTRDFSWLPNGIAFDPVEKTYIDVNFKIMISDVVAKQIEEKKEHLLTLAEARKEIGELLDN